MFDDDVDERLHLGLLSHEFRALCPVEKETKVFSTVHDLSDH